jgi:hypothetical protein
MRNPKSIAIWLLWLLAVVQHGAAFKHPLKQQQKHKEQQTQQQQQQQQQPFGTFMGLLAAHTAPAVAAYQSLQQHNHSLPIPLLNNGELAASSCHYHTPAGLRQRDYRGFVSYLIDYLLRTDC